MFDCSKDVLAHHDECVTLPDDERTEMRDRRDSNRDRLRDGLKKAGKPAPIEFKSQGSYAMRTMTQHPDLDYDIDDGVYFEKTDLVGPRGGEMSALEARTMVRDAIDDGSFAKAPEVRNNCVRVYYAAGYHVDLPVYRRVVTKDIFGREQTHYELASTTWKRSDARDVTEWFEKENNRQSPDQENGRQLRRVVRHVKFLARSRESWKSRILSGFGITKLVTEHFVPDAKREDVALYNTLKNIRDRLNWNLVVDHPCTQNETITNGKDDPKATFLKEKLSDTLGTLAPLFESGCTREIALKAWDKAFATSFFGKRISKAEETARSGPTILTSGLLREAGKTSAIREPVRREGGGRYA